MDVRTRLHSVDIERALGSDIERKHFQVNLMLLMTAAGFMVKNVDTAAPISTWLKIVTLLMDESKSGRGPFNPKDLKLLRHVEYIKYETKAVTITTNAGNLAAPKFFCDLTLPSILDKKNLVDAVAFLFRSVHKNLVLKEPMRKTPIRFKLLNLRAVASDAAGCDQLCHMPRGCTGSGYRAKQKS
jgi:hypothetical protein